MDAAMLLFHAIMCAQDGDTFLEWDRRCEMQALRALDHYRHEHDIFIQTKRDEMVQGGYLAPRDNPVLEARLKELEIQKLAEIEKAQQAVADERRTRSSKGGTAAAMFPSLVFRTAYDAIQTPHRGTKGDLEYLRILHLAASTMESDVAAALSLLQTAGSAVTADAVKAMIAATPTSIDVPTLAPLAADLAAYDALLAEVAA
jgi:hypothetical protein